MSLKIEWNEETFESVASSTSPGALREAKLAAIAFLDATEAKINTANNKFNEDRAAIAVEDTRKEEVKKFEENLKKEDAAIKKAADEAAKTAEKDFLGPPGPGEPSEPPKTGPLPDDFPGRSALREADINTFAQARKASLAEGGLQALPGIGPETENRILEALK